MVFQSRRIAAFFAPVFLLTTVLGPNCYFPPAQAAEKKVQKSKKKPKPKPEVTVLGFRSDRGLIERQTRTYLSRALKKSGRLRITSDKTAGKLADKLSSEEEGEVQALLAEAKKNYDEGRQFYETLSLDKAIRSLNEAVRGYRQGIDGLKNNRYLLASHLYLGMALIIRGRETDGEAFIKQMIVLDPQRKSKELPRKEYPPKIVKKHAELTKEVLREPSGTVVLQTKPSGAKVYFDAVQQPSTPHQISKVPVGEHFVVFQKPGYRRISKAIKVKPGQNKVTIDLESFNPNSPYTFERRYDTEVNERLVRIGRRSKSEILLLGEMGVTPKKKLELRAQLYDTRSKDFSKIVVQKASRGKLKSAAEKMAKTLLKHITKGGSVVAQIGPGGAKFKPIQNNKFAGKQPQKAVPASDPFYTKWWFWTAIGVVAIGGAGALFLLTRSDPDFNIVNVTPPQ